jgi:hypothetical protein
MSHLVPCPECSRHVRVSETECPFCALPLDLAGTPEPQLPRTRLGRAATFAFGATLASATALAACGGKTAESGTGNVAPPYGLPPPPPAGGSGGDAGTDMNTGGAAGTTGGAGNVSGTGNVVPPYGLPPPPPPAGGSGGDAGNSGGDNGGHGGSAGSSAGGTGGVLNAAGAAVYGGPPIPVYGGTPAPD